VVSSSIFIVVYGVDFGIDKHESGVRQGVLMALGVVTIDVLLLVVVLLVAEVLVVAEVVKIAMVARALVLVIGVVLVMMLILSENCLPLC